ncbi:hypothetical protein H310_03849 [Aphanomyces invadans]|uniref:Uncharacterized protein n=1 Tax=Aphanomyces invadans TaxID=157072 RepID=A0A024UEQ3_9STRA|nr:hypothetical protein H310_03849 [Aphanomyces invadans]ETW04690.1 hypothetical protein H310_03849 [Aphanomyces invadans]|eukprot:XP_008866128.1 hypothetical protein H310_03849 [Aphanomyces invadans]
MALPGIQVSGTSSGSISRGVPAGMSPQPSHQQTPAASSTAARASITHALMDARACHKCLDTFLTASAVHSIDIDGTEVQRHLQLLLHTKWQSDELANDGVNMTWRVNETQVDHVPHRAVLVEASPFGWTWTVVDVFSTNSTTTSFRWRAEGYFTGRFDGQLGDGQVLEQDGFGQYNSQESRMDLYYNPCKLLSRLEEYAASAKRRLGTFAA